MVARQQRPDSSVVEHFHGKEGVDSSILSRGSTNKLAKEIRKIMDARGLKDTGIVSVEITWTSVKPLTGSLELIYNGKVVAKQEGTAKPGEPIVLKANQNLTTKTSKPSQSVAFDI